MELSKDDKAEIKSLYRLGYTAKYIADKLVLEYSEAKDMINGIIKYYKSKNPDAEVEHKQNRENNKQGYFVVYDAKDKTIYHTISTTDQGTTRRNMYRAMRAKEFTNDELQIVYNIRPDDLVTEFHNRHSPLYDDWARKHLYPQPKSVRDRERAENKRKKQERDQHEAMMQRGIAAAILYDEDVYLPVSVLIDELIVRNGLHLIENGDEYEFRLRELKRLVSARCETANRTWGPFNEKHTSVQAHINPRWRGDKFLLSQFIGDEINQHHVEPKGAKTASELEAMDAGEYQAYMEGRGKYEVYDERSDPNFFGYFSRSDTPRVNHKAEESWRQFSMDLYQKQHRKKNK